MEPPLPCPLEAGWEWIHTVALPPDNWEALAVGPRLRDEPTTLVSGNDDNFKPLQSSWLAVMAPRRTEACPD